MEAELPYTLALVLSVGGGVLCGAYVGAGQRTSHWEYEGGLEITFGW